MVSHGILREASSVDFSVPAGVDRIGLRQELWRAIEGDVEDAASHAIGEGAAVASVAAAIARYRAGMAGIADSAAAVRPGSPIFEMARRTVRLALAELGAGAEPARGGTTMTALSEETRRLIDAFDLGDEVAALVRERVAAAPGTWRFTFRGSGNPGCGSTTPHMPHWRGMSYETVRAGRVHRFCRGVPGTLPDGGALTLVPDPDCHGGSPTSLAYYAGTAHIAAPASVPD